MSNLEELNALYRDALTRAEGESANEGSKHRDPDAWLLARGECQGSPQIISVHYSEEGGGKRSCCCLVNIKQFGAIGDGKTDDTAAWNAWQAALHPEEGHKGGLGYIPAGDYLVAGEVLSFPHGCIGVPKPGFSDILPGRTDRFSNAIPIGQGHEIDITRSFTMRSSAEGRHLYPAISINTDVDVPETTEDALTITGVAGGGLISSCHGIYLQHILTGGNSTNRMMSAGLVTNAINNAIGDNDCSGVAARATKTANAGVGDCAGLGGRIDNYSEQRGAVMGAEMACYNHAQGMPCPSDYSNVSTSRWATPLHITGHSTGGSPATAAILIQGSRVSNPYWDGIQFSYTMFPSYTDQPSPFTKNVIPGSGSSAPETVEYVEDDYENAAGVPTTRWRLENTVAINMGGFSHSGGHPDTCIKMGTARQHIWTPNRFLTVRSHGIDCRAGGNIYIRAAPKVHKVYVEQEVDGVVEMVDTGEEAVGLAAFQFCHRPLESTDYEESVVDASIHYRAGNRAVTLHNYGGNFGIVTYKPDTDGATNSGSKAYFVPDMCTKTSDDNDPGHTGTGPFVSKISLGSGTRPWTDIYATTTHFGSSDERIKQDIGDIPEAVMRAWGRVQFQQFRFREAVGLKGNAARKHIGVIAQRVIEAFEDEGLDAFAYGLIGHDVSPAKEAVYRDYDVRHEAEYSEDGSVVAPAWTEHVHELVSGAEPAIDLYSIRYAEALALECAYQRWRLNQLEQRLNGGGDV